MTARSSHRASSPGRSAYGPTPTGSSYGASGRVSDPYRGYQGAPHVATADDFHDTLEAMEEHMMARQQQYHPYHEEDYRFQEDSRQRPRHHGGRPTGPPMRNNATPLGATMAMHPQLEDEYGEYVRTVDMDF